jgi:putative PEP-CTERM system TPR-repeat lipoprotein
MTNLKLVNRRWRGVRACLGLAMAMLVLGGCGDRKTAEEHTKNGEAHLLAGDVRAAIVDLKNALQKEPNNARARLLLGQAYNEISESSNAEAELVRARDGGIAAADYAVPLAQAQFGQRKLDEVLKTTEAPDGASPALKASLLAVRALAYAGLGRTDEAVAALDQGLAENSHSVDVLLGMARFALARGDRETAKSRMAEAQKEAPKDPRLMALEGDIDYAGHDYVGSEVAYQHMLDAQSWDYVPRLGLARAQVAQSKLKEAIVNLDALLKVAPKDPQINYFRGLAAYRGGDYAGGLAFSQRTLSAMPNHMASQLLAGASSYALGQYEQANNFLGAYVFRVPRDLEARKLLATTQLQLNHPGDAVKTLRPAVANSEADADLLAMIGAAAARSGDSVQANEYLVRAVAKAPENAALRTELGLAEVALGKTETGIEELEKSVQENPQAIRAELALFLTYMRTREVDKALAVAERLQKTFPDDPLGLNLAGIAHLGKGDTAAGKAALLKAHAMQPGDANADRNLAKISIAEKKFDEARGYYREALKADPKNMLVYLDLADLETRDGHADQAEAALKEAVRQNPSEYDPRIALARFYLARGQNQEALAVSEPATNQLSQVPALLEVVGRAEMLLGRGEAAVTTYKTLTDVAPQSAEAHRYLSEAYTAVRKGDLALREASEALRLDPSNEDIKFDVAKLLMMNARFEDARIAIDDLRKRHPDNGNIAELDGTNALQQNRPNDAVAAFKRAIAVSDNSANRLFLATALSRAGHVEEAELTLKPWLESHQDDLAVRMGLGDIYLAANRLSEAKEQYSLLLAKAPDSFGAENNYAWVLSQMGQPKEALAHARHAAVLAPESPEALDTLGQILLQNDIAPEASATLKKAFGQARDKPEIQFHLAQALVADNQRADALAILRRLLAGFPSFKDRDRAEQLLQQLSDD